MASTQMNTVGAAYARLPSRTTAFSRPSADMMMESPPDSPSLTPNTTSPDSEIPGKPSDPQASNVPLSCTRCQARKIKCDRTFPCSTCRKARLDAQCTPATRAPRKPRKHPAKELKKRVERCEQYLREFSSSTALTGLPGLPAVGRATSEDAATLAHNAGKTPSTGTRGTPDSSWIPLPPHLPVTEGKLVEGDDGKVVFMDNSLLASVHEELRSMRDIIAADDRDCEDHAPSPLSTSTTTTPSHRNKSGLLLGNHSSSSDSTPLWPSSHHVFRHWQTYLDRVNPLTKIIHAPSLQPYLVDASVSQQKVPPNLQCLCFGIFLMACISLSDAECRSQLDSPRKDLIARYTQGVEIILQQLDFLRANDLVLLQALVLYMISMQGRADDHYSWNLNGVVVRIAQKMGLHRDGLSLGLSPFKTEMRRRVWWQIIYLDGKFACSSGLTQSLVPRNWTVPEPTNVNDADIFPAATEPFVDHEGPTEMVLAQVQYKITRFLLHAPGLGMESGKLVVPLPTTSTTPESSGSGRHGTAPDHIAPFRAACEDLFRELASLRQTRCHPSGGRTHKVAARFLDILLGHFRNIFGDGGDNVVFGGVADLGLGCAGVGTGKPMGDGHVFFLAVAQITICNQITRACVDTDFGWFAAIHFPLDVLVYLVRRLPMVEKGEGEGEMDGNGNGNGEMVRNAWKQVEEAYGLHSHLYDLDEDLQRVLGRSVLDAWRRRRETHPNLSRTAPEYVEKLASMLGESIEGSSESPLPTKNSSTHNMNGMRDAEPVAQVPDYPGPQSQFLDVGDRLPLTAPVPSGPTFDELFSDGTAGPWIDESELQTLTAQQMSYFMGFGMIPLAR